MPASLDYAPTIPWQRRRRTRRAAIYLLALAVIALTFWIITPLIYARFSLIYWQSRCLDYTEPPPPTTAPSPNPRRSTSCRCGTEL